MASITAPRVRVTVEQASELVEYVVQTDNRDMVAWDMTRPRKQWPAGDTAPMLWLTFLAWSALRREGHTTAKIDDFLDQCVSVAGVTEDGDEVDPATGDPDSLSVGPTTPDHVSG